MEDLRLYFELGWDHIISVDALDHILFIIALTATYQLKQWKPVLILVTAFTIGHSATLMLSVYEIITFNDKLVEILIPCTILITCFFNYLKTEKRKTSYGYYLIALLFGLIHGLGFANTIRFMLSQDQSIGLPLLGFNLGLEAGQIVIVFIVLLIAWLVVDVMKLKFKYWIILLSWTAFVFACRMIFERI